MRPQASKLLDNRGVRRVLHNAFHILFVAFDLNGRVTKAARVRR